MTITEWFTVTSTPTSHARISSGTYIFVQITLPFDPTTGSMFVGLGSSNTLANSYGALDIIGHEFTHGVTGSTVGLVYSGESGAINESLSDILVP